MRSVAVVTLLALSASCALADYIPEYCAEYEPMKRFVVVTNNKLNWEDASLACQEDGGQLATILSPRENCDALKAISRASLGNSNLGIWVGATLNDEDGKYYWNTGESLKRYTTWWNDQPDGSGKCMQYWKRWNWLEIKLDDNRCHYLEYYMCEYML